MEPATTIQRKDVMTLIDLYADACRNWGPHLAKYERGKLLAALALDDCIAEEKRNQRPRIVWGKETRMWMCIGPNETIGYGDTPRIAFYNWQKTV